MRQRRPRPGRAVGDGIDAVVLIGLALASLSLKELHEDWRSAFLARLELRETERPYTHDSPCETQRLHASLSPLHFSCASC